MNKELKKRLDKLELEYLKEKYLFVPEYALARTKWSDSNTNELTKSIIKFIKYNGYQSERINTMGVYRAPKNVTDVVGRSRTLGKGKWTKGTGTRGSSDISATIKGRSVKIEVKFGKDRQSEYQKAYQRTIEKAGGVYIIAKNMTDFVEWYDDFIKNI
jgi:hypothetical protein